jgi:hypothetical protein
MEDGMWKVTSAKWERAGEGTPLSQQQAFPRDLERGYIDFRRVGEG